MRSDCSCAASARELPAFQHIAAIGAAFLVIDQRARFEFEPPDCATSFEQRSVRALFELPESDGPDSRAIMLVLPKRWDPAAWAPAPADAGPAALARHAEKLALWEAAGWAPPRDPAELASVMHTRLSCGRWRVRGSEPAFEEHLYRTSPLERALRGALSP